MQDRWEYTIPANTAEANAIRVECKISPGVLTDLMVYFPRGCQNLARCRVFLGEKPIMPRSRANYLAAEDMAVDHRNINVRVREDLPVLNWDVWNIDDTYPHTIWMAAQWMSEDEPYELMIFRVMRDFVNAFKRITGL